MLLAPIQNLPRHEIPISRPFLPSEPHPPIISSSGQNTTTPNQPSARCLMASPAAPPFLIKTYAMVDDPGTDDTISWNESGTAFVVWRRAEFERDLLPRNFKHSNFASFVRQLNTYGFKKVGIDRWEFANDCFRRGQKHLLGAIQRRKGIGAGLPAPALLPTAIPISPTPTSSSGDPAVSSSPPPPGLPAPGASGAVAELEEENAWLRRENARLARELARARRVCDGVRHLVSMYDHGGEEEQRPGGKPMLFGVAIGSKRSRSREDGDEEYEGGENGGDDEEDEEQEDDERHGARREPAAMSRRRTEPSDLDVLALSVRAAAAARPDGGRKK
ncbi:heat stress transcription factor B-2a-like [Lolium rigidum]|uniref:heat stress transcription factor B-2a-like n=1 Tax=Lolium rigidum TaxID=89674 RepID=UPI001F5C6BF2|nr:heat stress transcription factor B-2a-like [Lolium rigidum]